ncbi:signal peptidase I [Marinomonas rhizomae]|uniref:signal peptidase I n=1 Tax=Marinomonas rhizomae TaxID=491948 RepID=UPI001314191F|nr:signal peptidase I [Marinomonas rhizomae]
MKKRSPIWALVLSVLSPGFGHVYAGNLKKGLWLFLLQTGGLFVFGKLGWLSAAYGIWFFMLFLLCLYSYAILSAVRLALANQFYELKSYNRWYCYLAILALILALGQTLISSRGALLGFELYQVPSRSMMPTLQPGDYIAVDTKDLSLNIGDVVVFRYPNNRQTLFTKRIVALGNDRVAIENGQVILNGKAERIVSVDERFRRSEVSMSMSETVVPEGQIFVLGDWRDNSNDSRYWGAFSESNVIGKVTYIWLSKEFSRLGNKITPSFL